MCCSPFRVKLSNFSRQVGIRGIIINQTVLTHHPFFAIFHLKEPKDVKTSVCPTVIQKCVVVIYIPMNYFQNYFLFL